MTPGTLPSEMRACATAPEAERVLDIRRAAPIHPDEEREALAVLDAMRRKEAR